jgi:hypothetical protein
MDSMKILKICSLNYGEVIRGFYRRNAHLRDLTYAEHKRELLRFAPVHLNGFSEYMRQLGYECDEVIVDLENLQKRWAQEAGFAVPNHGWQLEILLRQIENFKPDLLYLQDVGALHPAVRRRIKRFYPFIRGVIVYRGFPVVEEGFHDIDLLLTGAVNLQSAYENLGVPVRFLPHAFEASILDNVEGWPSPYLNSRTDFAFLGYAGFGGHGVHHKERFDFLLRLLDETPLRCWLAEFPAEAADKPAPFFQEHRDRCSPGLMGLELHQVLRGARVVFNKHSSAHPGQVENMRLFEATGIGTCLLTDDGHNLPALFERDREVVTYHSFEECVEKLSYLLEHERERAEIAAAGQARTLREHTWKNRARTLDGYLREVFQ